MSPSHKVISAASCALCLAVAVGACADGDTSPPGGTSSSGAGGGAATTAATSSSGVAAGGAGGADLPPVCAVPSGELDAEPYCGPEHEPLDDLVLTVKWLYDVPLVDANDAPMLYFPPLVANLNDDNGDGVIDLCDTPDVLVKESHTDSSAKEPQPDNVVLAVLSGADGHLQGVIDPGELSFGEPAIADLDADGVPEILAANRQGHAVALSPSGAVMWESAAEVFDPIGAHELDPPIESYLRARYVFDSSFAVHDLEGDGVPEVQFGMTVLEADGSLRFQDPTQGAEYGVIDAGIVRPTVADLDGDGELEVLFGHVAYSASGVELWRLPQLTPGTLAHAADFDGDGAVEVLLTSEEGLTLVSAAGEVLWGPTTLDFGEPPRVGCWAHPAALTDFGLDGEVEALVNTCQARMVVSVRPDAPEILRSEPVPLPNAVSAPPNGSTAFDFRGVGVDWVAHHHQELSVYAGKSATLLAQLDATFVPGWSYPIVADVDNDASADVVTQQSPSRVVVYQDSQKRHSPARRIWNQWDYSPRFVREDARVPNSITGPSSLRVQSRLGCSSAVPPT